MKQLCLIFLVSIIPFTGFSINLGDTINIYIDNRIELKLSTPDYSKLKSSGEELKALRQFEALLPDISDQLTANNPEIVRYQLNNTLTVEPGNPKHIFLEKKGKMSNTGFRDQAYIQGDDFSITITTTDISKINELQVSNCMENVIAKLPYKIRWSKTISYECINGEITELESKNNELDMLQLQLGAGAGLIRNRWVTDISFGVGLKFFHKGVPRGPYISSNMIFDFDSENKINLNTFVNLGYQFSLNRNANDPNMLGIELGYLVSRKGELFGENTLKLAFNWSPAKYVTVSPQLYMTDNFKQIFPGIRIGFGF